MKDFYWAKIKTELPKTNNCDLKLHDVFSLKERKDLRYAFLFLKALPFSIPKPVRKLIVAEDVSLMKKLSKPMKLGSNLRNQTEKTVKSEKKLDIVSQPMEINPPTKEVPSSPKNQTGLSFFARYFNTNQI